MDMTMMLGIMEYGGKFMEKNEIIGVMQSVYDNMVANGTIDENTLYYILDYNKFINVVFLGDSHIIASYIDGNLYETFDGKTWSPIKNPIDINTVFDSYKPPKYNNKIIEKLHKEGLL